MQAVSAGTLLVSAGAGIKAGVVRAGIHLTAEADGQYPSSGARTRARWVPGRARDDDGEDVLS